MSPKRRPARRRNRPWRDGGWDPIDHNRSVAFRKEMRTFTKSALAAARTVRRMIHALPPVSQSIRVVMNTTNTTTALAESQEGPTS